MTPPGAGHGFIDIFDTEGNLVDRFTTVQYRSLDRNYWT
jgi:hypothetical protein